VTYRLRRSRTPDGGTVDLMNPEAVRKFIEIYYEELFRRYGEYFGTLSRRPRRSRRELWRNHCLDAAAVETFRNKAGYDLEPFLPALVYDIGHKTEKVRCDYLDTISDLYSRASSSRSTDGAALTAPVFRHVWKSRCFLAPGCRGFLPHLARHGPARVRIRCGNGAGNRFG